MKWFLCAILCCSEGSSAYSTRRESFIRNPQAGIPGHRMKGLAKAEHRPPNPTAENTQPPSSGCWAQFVLSQQVSSSRAFMCVAKISSQGLLAQHVEGQVTLFQQNRLINTGMAAQGTHLKRQTRMRMLKHSLWDCVHMDTWFWISKSRSFYILNSTKSSLLNLYYFNRYRLFSCIINAFSLLQDTN